MMKTVVALSGAVAVTALLGLLFAPLWTIWFWAVLQGIGQGGLIAVALTVIGVAITVYLAVHSELFSQVDAALNDRARPFLTGPGPRSDGDEGPRLGVEAQRGVAVEAFAVVEVHEP
jgi:hypothetical protein